jgi:D-alanyl-D-alanine carboxypeptidase
LGKTLPRGAVIVAGKTGYLIEAGFCFAGEFRAGEKRIITVILGAPSEAERFSETERILDWTLGSYLWDNTK